MTSSFDNGEAATNTTTVATVSSPPSSDAIQRLLNADPFLTELVRGLPVCFAGIPYAKEAERQQNLLHSIQLAKRLHIALPSNGLNLHLSLSSEHLLLERSEVQFTSEFLFNGVQVRLCGHINIRTLHGKVQVELTQSLCGGVQRPTHSERRRRQTKQRMGQLRAAALRL